ncbi:MAG: hypothetical protein VZR00_02670 [Lachnospiraceae bacterium]|nr:hypothetical protein [Lachnospiraceae bacterium]
MKHDKFSRIAHYKLPCRRSVNILLMITLSMISIIVALIPAKASLAASATVDISTSDNDIRRGSEFYLIIKVQADEIINNISGTVFYDPDLMKFRKGSKSITDRNGAFVISSDYTGRSVEKVTYAVKFKAKKKGKALISFGSSFAVTGSESGQLSLCWNDISLKIKGKKKKSDEPLTVTKEEADPDSESSSSENGEDMPDDDSTGDRFNEDLETASASGIEIVPYSGQDADDDIISSGSSVDEAQQGQVQGDPYAGRSDKGRRMIILLSCLTIGVFITVFMIALIRYLRRKDRFDPEDDPDDDNEDEI